MKFAIVKKTDNFHSLGRYLAYQLVRDSDGKPLLFDDEQAAKDAAAAIPPESNIGGGRSERVTYSARHFWKLAKAQRREIQELGLVA